MIRRERQLCAARFAPYPPIGGCENVVAASSSSSSSAPRAARRQERRQVLDSHQLARAGKEGACATEPGAATLLLERLAAMPRHQQTMVADYAVQRARTSLAATLQALQLAYAASSSGSCDAEALDGALATAEACMALAARRTNTAMRVVETMRLQQQLEGCAAAPQPQPLSFPPQSQEQQQWLATLQGAVSAHQQQLQAMLLLQQQLSEEQAGSDDGNEEVTSTFCPSAWC